MEKIIHGKPLLPRAVSVEALPNYILKIKFNNNEEKYFDAKKIYNLPCYKPLQNKEFFKTVHVEYGSIAWNNDIDYCPDCLYEESTERLSALAEKVEQKIIFETVQKRKTRRFRIYFL